MVMDDSLQVWLAVRREKSTRVVWIRGKTVGRDTILGSDTGRVKSLSVTWSVAVSIKIQLH